MSMLCSQCEQTAKGTGCTVRGVCGKDPEVAALQDLLIHAVKGIAMYAHRARQLGAKDAAVDRFVGTVRSALSTAGVESRTMDDKLLPTADLAGVRLLVFPYNPGGLPEGAVDAVRSYVGGGGRLAVFYSSHGALLELVGVREVRYVGGDDLPDLSGIRFDTGAVFRVVGIYLIVHHLHSAVILSA